MAPQRISSSVSQSNQSTNDLSVDVIDTQAKMPLTPAYTNYDEMSEVDKGTAAVTTDTAPLSRFVTHSQHLRECLAEFLGTWVMICFGFGVNNQVDLNPNGSKGTWLSINMCWGIAVLLGVHCSEGVSGAHLNPAVTVTMATYKRLPWQKVPGYVLAQLLGAFIGAWTIFLLHYQTLDAVDPERTFTRSHFATYPRKGLNNYTAFYTEFLASAMLTLGVFCITDKKNRPASPFGAPIHFMLLIWAIGMAFGMNTGYAINPARDFAPRLFTSLAGWGFKVFTLNHHYFWIPIVAPCMGGVVGGGIYKLFVQNHHPRAPSPLPL
ncbi:hypothetical protein PINS_up005896 [Pythium insidiosum]|nr:hypothetical protein PINS_up005896 [Pythium insidiosum]